MKFPESWLRDFVESPLTGEALGDALTMAGLEVEEFERAAPPFDQVVVARVLLLLFFPTEATRWTAPANGASPCATSPKTP